jgi:anti-anti-sigma factor
MSARVKVLEPSGILDGLKGDELSREIKDAVNAGTEIVLIDLKDIPFMDTSGLGVLISATKRVRSAGHKLFLCSVNEQIKMLFDLTETDRFFEKFADQFEFKRQMEG